MSKRYFASLPLMLLIATSGIAGGAPVPSPPLDPAGPAAGRDTVVIGTTDEPAGVHPLYSQSGTAVAVVAAIFTTDVEWNPLTGRLFAQGVEYLPNIHDGTWTLDGSRMTLLWKIRPRSWHDGRQVTCADYVFTFAVMRNERVPGFSSRREAVSRIANVICPKGDSGTEIAVNWNGRFALATQAVLAQFVSWVVLPRHMLEPYYRANPSRFDQTPYGYEPAATLGDGPYRLVAWRRGESLTVEAVAAHPVFGTPAIRRIVWRFFRDRNAMVEHLVAGTIDLIIPAGGIALDQAVELERRAAGRVRVFFRPAPLWEHIDFNLDHPLLGDVRVRRAIAHGVNRTQLVQQLFYGKAVVAHTYLDPSSPGYTDDVQRYPYNPARSRTLLREVGFVPDPDGIMRHTSSQRLSLELSTTAGNRIREQVQLMIQQQLRQVGIEITIRNFPSRLFFGEIMTRRKFTLAMYLWSWEPSSGCEVYASSGIPAASNSWVGDNFPGFKSAEMDRVCAAISGEVDADQRKRLLRESARIFARNLPALPLYYPVVSAAAKVELENFFGPAVPTTAMWNVHTWYWR